MNVNRKYDTRVWWYFYPTDDGAGTYKIGNALTGQVYYPFLSFRLSRTKDKATAWTFSGATWPLPAGDDDDRDDVASDDSTLTALARGVILLLFCTRKPGRRAKSGRNRCRHVVFVVAYMVLKSTCEFHPLQLRYLH